TDELLKLGGRDFTQTLEAGYLGALAQLLRRLVAFSLRVTINRLLFVAHAEQRRFEHEQMAVVNQWLEKTEKIGDQQIADVQSIHVGVGGEDDLFIAQTLDAVLDVQAAHEVVHFVVLIDDVALEVPDIQRFAFQNKNRLRRNVAATHDGAGGALAFGEEDHRAFTFPFGFVEVQFAILELRDADGDGFGAFAREFFYLLQFLAKLPGIFDFGDDVLRDFLVTIQEVEKLFPDLVHQLGSDFRVAEFVLCLRLKDGVFQANCDRAHHALAHVVA